MLGLSKLFCGRSYLVKCQHLASHGPSVIQHNLHAPVDLPKKVSMSAPITVGKLYMEPFEVYVRNQPVKRTLISSCFCVRKSHVAGHWTYHLALFVRHVDCNFECLLAQLLKCSKNCVARSSYATATDFQRYKSSEGEWQNSGTTKICGASIGKAEEQQQAGRSVLATCIFCALIPLRTLQPHNFHSQWIRADKPSNFSGSQNLHLHSTPTFNPSTHHP